MTVAIIDYGLGNLFSVQNACNRVGVHTVVTSDPAVIDQSSGLILPGVGAFGDAMAELRRRQLLQPLLDYVASGRSLLGICLGMQLLMSESHEYGCHAGLGLIPGTVVRLPDRGPCGESFRVPHVGWSAINPPEPLKNFQNTPLAKLKPGSPMYFVHSYHCVPEHSSTILSMTEHGSHRFVSAIRSGNILGCQFHPEKSSHGGLGIYEEFFAKRSETTDFIGAAS